MTACRLLPFAVADGAYNMAADEPLLDAAAEGIASLRFYGWSEPTVSLGYFQPAAVRQAVPGLAALPWVRRATGGGALVHHHEVTYALALPPGLTWQPRGESWLCRMHRAVAVALASLGVQTEDACANLRRGEVLCFLHHTPGDLHIGDAKIVGSAQRRRHGSLLQHGSILLAASPFTPHLSGISELTGGQLAPEEVAAAVGTALSRGLERRLEPCDWTVAERRRIDDLAANKYAADAWNAKR